MVTLNGKKGEKMRPCYLYAKNYGKEGFVCEYEQLENPMYLRCAGNKDFLMDNTYCNKFCPKFEECIIMSGETYRVMRKANIVVNFFADGKISVLRREPFFVPKRVYNDKADRSRSFLKVNGNLLIPRKEKATPYYWKRNVYRAGRRAKDTFYGYALSNTWMYFFTFTFSPSLTDNRYNSDFTNKLWSKFQNKFRHWDSYVKIANVPEDHKDGAQHFHAFITTTEPLPIVDFGDISKLPQRTCNGGANKGKTGFCTYTPQGTFTIKPQTSIKGWYLVPYYNYGELQKDSLGNPLFCLNKYLYGICSCAILPGDETNQQMVSNYLSKYLTKQTNLGYNKKRFMHTRNLLNKKKLTLYLADDNNFDKFCRRNNLFLYEDKGKFQVYRNFGTEQSPSG